MARSLAFPLAVLVPLAFAGISPAQIGEAPLQLWEQVSPGIALPEQEDARFGGALAAGDFDGDGFEDLAVGIPEYDLDEATDAGLVLVLYGSWDGPSASGHDLWTQDNVLLLDDGEEDDRFGEALAAGDFDGDGYDDLAIGIPYETVADVGSAGAVHVLYGSSSGLSTADDQFLHQGSGGGAILGTAEESDRFGFSLAVGDFDDDGFDDLAIGVPYEQISDQVGAGALQVVFGSASGLTTSGDLLLWLGNGLPRQPIGGEYLARAMAAGDFVGQSPGDELALGAHGTKVNGLLDAGTVWIVSDLGGTPDAFPLDLDSTGFPDAPQLGDQFGCALAAGQLDGVGTTDLAITACRKPVDDADDAGKVYVWYGGARTPVALDQNDLPGEQPDPDDFFGSVLAAGDFDADGVDDLVVGVPFEDRPGGADAGIVHLFPGAADAALSKATATTIEPAEDPAEAGDRFGLTLAAGRLSGHSGSDLAIGAPYESQGMVEWTGGVHVYFSIALFLDGFESGDTEAWSTATLPL